ncbi:Uncharacterized protein TCM_032525 [Theobroma cacao]|uniref:RNase H type-1 domain-containing protein n=1 Tax=Theobroma cacao TaxID=3641 RepID=A0A061FHB1_THECC|nr:Uncharacterized protein TCM_032525 [Theobroma cacao]
MLSILLSFRRLNDYQIWFSNKYGEYTVKSGYWMLSFPMGNPGVGSSSSGIQGIWKKLWTLGVLRKLILFAWRLFKEALIQRRINVELCALCGVELEILFHCLGACQFARAVLFDKENVEEVVGILPVVWNARNALIFKQQNMDPTMVVEMGMDAAIFKVNGMKMVSACFMVESEAGTVQLAGVKKFRCGSLVVEAKLNALAWSLYVCCQENSAVKEVELDKSVAVGWLREKNYKGGARNIVEDCCLLMEQLRCIGASHCTRESNRSAHSVAQLGRKLQHENDQLIWTSLEALPEQILSVLRQDWIGLQEAEDG